MTSDSGSLGSDRPQRDPVHPLRLVIVGGGFTGVVVAIHAIEASLRALDIAIVEPAAALGRGVAYGTPDPTHRINVPTDKMSVSPDDPSEATRWFYDHGVLPDAASTDAAGHHYVSRAAYGAFVEDRLCQTVEEAAGRVTFRHLRCRATAVDGAGAQWQVSLEGLPSVQADIVALCFGHAVPHLPCRMDEDVSRHSKFIRDPWAQAALDAIAPDDTVLVVGTGLTMADVVASLRARGHAGAITAVSRRGLLSRPQGHFVNGLDILQGEAPPVTALALLRLIRRRVREAAPELGWQPVADAVRSALPLLWGTLPDGEKARVLRRLLPFWDVHRFRLAPQIHDVLVRDQAAGGLHIERGGLRHLARKAERFVATLQRQSGARDPLSFDAVVLCTGPEKDLRNNPLAASLLASGVARFDATGLGLAVDPDSRLIGRDGTPSRTAFAFGPMTRGTFGEMTGAPDITRHIRGVAARLAAEAEARA